MRKYVPKDNVQAKSYYTDRYWISPTVPIFKVESDKVFFSDITKLSQNFTIKEAYIQLEQMIISINSVDNFKIIEFLKDELDYKMCSEISAVDYLEKNNEFEVFYQMLSLTKQKRVRVICRIKVEEAVESIVPLFKSANFAEREMFDMFGIKSNNHPFLKRILMPDDWEGYPLLKTYPLEGDEFASWYEVDKIFGKSARDEIGPEIRDPAKIDRYDTKRFSRVGYEVPFGEEINKENEQETKIEYSETFLVNYKNNKELKDRK